MGRRKEDTSPLMLTGAHLTRSTGQALCAVCNVPIPQVRMQRPGDTEWLAQGHLGGEDSFDPVSVLCRHPFCFGSHPPLQWEKCGQRASCEVHVGQAPVPLVAAAGHGSQASQGSGPHSSCSWQVLGATCPGSRGDIFWPEVTWRAAASGASTWPSASGLPLQDSVGLGAWPEGHRGGTVATSGKDLVSHGQQTWGSGWQKGQ